MYLSLLWGEDKDLLICDFAEYYHIFNIKDYSILYIATLARGLSDNSRTKKSISQVPADTNTLLLAILCDRLGALIASLSGGTMPESIYDNFFNREKQSAYETFQTPEEFMARYKELSTER